MMENNSIVGGHIN